MGLKDLKANIQRYEEIKHAIDFKSWDIVLALVYLSSFDESFHGVLT